MGLFLNPGNALFQEALNSEIYVDKTGLIARTNAVLSTQEKYLCVSRPRRFGKTMAASMLCAYYGAGCDSREQFRGLAAERVPSFEEHLNAYNVVHINIQNMLHYGENTVQGLISQVEKRVNREIRREIPEVDPLDESLTEYLSEAYVVTGRLFVFIIDEWDCVFRVKGVGKDDQREYLDWLRALLKDRPYVALAYMTGILPVKKYGEHSALNMFDEVSMTNAWPLAEYTGFTDGEVSALCERYGRDLREVRAWYDGYLVNGVHIFNPRSVVKAVQSGIFDSYWTRTETFAALRDYIMMDFDGLRGKVAQLIGGARVDVNTLKFQNDMTSLQSVDDVLTLLIHLGYLTYDLDARQVWIPNQEVRGEFVNCIEDRGWESVMDAIRASEKLMRAVLAGDAGAVAAGVEASHRANASILKYNDENSLACVVSLAFFAAQRTHKVVREMPAGEGFADLVFQPLAGAGAPGLVMELKRGGTAQDAIDQIRARNYAEALRGMADEVLLVGLAYDGDKQHTCVIEHA